MHKQLPEIGPGQLTKIIELKFVLRLPTLPRNGKETITHCHFTSKLELLMDETDYLICIL